MAEIWQEMVVRALVQSSPTTKPNYTARGSKLRDSSLSRGLAEVNDTREVWGPPQLGELRQPTAGHGIHKAKESLICDH